MLFFNEMGSGSEIGTPEIRWFNDDQTTPRVFDLASDELVQFPENQPWLRGIQ